MRSRDLAKIEKKEGGEKRESGKKEERREQRAERKVFAFAENRVHIDIECNASWSEKNLFKQQ